MTASLSVARTFANLALSGHRVIRRVHEIAVRAAFAEHGTGLRFDPRGSYTFETIRVGNDVSIGIGAVLWAVEPAYIEIRDKVMLGPYVSLIAGDHVFDVPGLFMADRHSKRSTDDVPIIVEEDVWIGANATILKGVTVGRGSVIAAGSVITKSVAPYSVMAGVPGRCVRSRFNDEQIVEHESQLFRSQS